MAFASVVGHHTQIITGNDTTIVLDWSVSIGPVTVGDKILVTYLNDDNTTVTNDPAGYTRLVRYGDDPGVLVGEFVAWEREATGGETGVTITWVGNEKVACHVHVLRGAGTIEWQLYERHLTNQVTQTPFTPAGGADDILWFASVQHSGNNATLARPEFYDDTDADATGGGSGFKALSIVHRQNNTPTETPLAAGESYSWNKSVNAAGNNFMWAVYPSAPAGPVISGVGPAVATTTTLLAGSTYDVANGVGGTTWTAVYRQDTPPAGATPSEQHASIKAGLGAVGSTANNPIVDAAITDGQNTVDTEVTGLNSDTDYDLWIAIEDSGSVEGDPAFGAFKTANANPFITEQLNFVAVNASAATHRMTASDADDPNVEYLVAYYPNNTGGAVTDTQLEDDCRNAPAGGGVPSPNPRGCLWARSITLTQGTQYVDTAVGLSSLQSYDVESGVADAVNPTVRGVQVNITMGFKTCTQALPWKNADGTDIGALNAIAWRWKDTALGAYTDSGEIDISATGVWNANPNIEGSTLVDGQIGYFEAELDVRIQTYRYVVASTPGSVN